MEDLLPRGKLHVGLGSAPVRAAVALFPWLPIVASGGCATLFHGARQPIEVTSNPTGAVATSRQARVTTPGVPLIPRRARVAVVCVEKTGYRTRVVTLERRTSTLVWTNAGFAVAGLALGAAAAIASALSDTGEDYGAELFATGGLLAAGVGFAVDLAVGGRTRAGQQPSPSSSNASLRLAPPDRDRAWAGAMREGRRGPRTPAGRSLERGVSA